MQCLCRKLDDWESESDDEDFEREAEYCFLSGISKSGVDEFDVEELEPVRHGIDSTLINNVCEEDDPGDQWAVPMHPGCFEMYKRMCVRRFGKVNIDGLWRLRNEQGDYENRFGDFPERADVELVKEQYHVCVRGTEYLAATPIEPLGLQALIDSCTGAADEVAFTSGPAVSEGRDPFSRLSFELRSTVLMVLGKRDVANLRLASASFVRLPQSYFRNLVQTEMPWVWELESLPSATAMDWHALWTDLSRADGGALLDEKYREHRQKVIMDSQRREEWEAELNRRGIKRNDPKWFELYSKWAEEAKREALEQLKREEHSGRWRTRPDPKEIKGLRNRRMIWRDIEMIVRRIEELGDEDGDEE